MPSPPIPRLPVFGWSTFAGAAEADVPCMLSLPGATFTTSGRAAILLALEAMGIGPGDQVLLPTYHCPTMVAPVVHLQAAPLFYPIDARGAPSMAWLESQNLRHVRVLLVAHLFGLPQPLAALRSWCDDRGVALLEDCAHALFGRSGGRPVGAWGDMAIGSLTKFLPLSAGGCLVSNKTVSTPVLAPVPPLEGGRLLLDAVELAALHGRLAGLNRAVSGVLALARSFRGTKPLESNLAGRDGSSAPDLGALGGIDAALAHQALPGVGRWMASRIPRARIVNLRRDRYRQLSQRLSGHRGLRPLMPELPENCAPYVFPLWVENPDPGYAKLRALRMPVSRWDWLWPGVPRIEGDQGVIWSHHVLQLACHQDISDADLDCLVHELLQLYSAVPAPSTSCDAAPCALQND